MGIIPLLTMRDGHLPALKNEDPASCGQGQEAEPGRTPCLSQVAGAHGSFPHARDSPGVSRPCDELRSSLIHLTRAVSFLLVPRPFPYSMPQEKRQNPRKAEPDSSGSCR